MIYQLFRKKSIDILMLKICVMGLGYVGLPICLELSKKYKTTGFDINKSRIANLRKNIDFNNEFKKKRLFLKKN